MEGLVGLLVVVGLIVFWVYQLVDVVSMSDKEFKGRNDKLIFFMIVFFGSIFGALGFVLWKYFRAKGKKADPELEAAFKEFMKQHQKDMQQGESHE